MKFEITTVQLLGVSSKTGRFTLNFDHLSYLELEACVNGSSGFLIVHFCRRLGLKKPTVVPF